MARMTKAQKQEQAEAIAHLRKVCKRGSTVYTSCSHVSRSGMMRHISTYVVRKGEVTDITGYVALAIGYTRARSGGMKVGGCGMDMGFHVVHTLSYVLHGHDAHDASGSKRSGYTLTQRWL